MQAYIKKLETAIRGWTNGKLRWDGREKTLQVEKAALLQQYNELKLQSEQRNEDLQRQIDELRTLYPQQSIVLTDSQRKRPKIDIRTPPPTRNEAPNSVSDSAEKMDTTPPSVRTSKSSSPPPIFIYGIT